MEGAKTTGLLFKAVEFWATFDIQINVTLAIFSEKLHCYTF